MHLVMVDNLLMARGGPVPMVDLHPHLGLLSLAAVARSGGHDVTIWDPKASLVRGELSADASIYASAARQLLALKPDVLGFTSLGASFIFALQVAQRVRQLRADLPIVLGGPHATVLHEAIMERFPEFDAVARHESEDTLLPLLGGLSGGDLADIPGLTWRRSGEVVVNPGAPTIADLDRLPMSAYDLYPAELYRRGHIRVEAGRGCPFHCTFCSTATFFGRSYRLKSPAKLVGELDALHATYGQREFALNHDLFTVNKRQVRAFCAAVRDRGYDWSVSARVDCVDPELLEEMWAAGCRRIYFGVETGSRRMQKIAQKWMDLDLLEPTLDVLERLGMHTTASYITGYPEEEEEDQAATLDSIGRIFRRPDRQFQTQLHMLTPEPGTALHTRYADQLGIDDYKTDFNAPRLAPEDDALIRTHREVFLTYYHYPTQIPRERHIFVVDATAALRRAGHAAMDYTLRSYDGRLSVLVAALWDWSLARGWTTRVGPDLLVAYFQDVHGPRNHLTTLFDAARGLPPGRASWAGPLVEIASRGAHAAPPPG